MNLIRGVSVRPAADVTTFLRAVALNFLVGNSDGHGKNFAILYDPVGQGRLAPVYDVVSTAVYDVASNMAMLIGGVEEPDAVDQNAWRVMAEEAHVSGPLLLRDLRALAEKVVACAHAVRDAARVEGWHRSVLDEIVRVVELRASQIGIEEPAAR